MKEKVKPIYIDGEESEYLIYNDGRVFSLYQNRFIKPSYTSGYQAITLSHNNERKRYYIHRLVATAFIPNPKKLLLVNHKDLNRSNNNVKNLEWIDYRGNYIHAIKSGAYISNKYPRIKKKDVELIGQMLESGSRKIDIIKALPQYNEGTIRQLLWKPSLRDLKILSKYDIKMKKYSLSSYSNIRGRSVIDEKTVKKIIRYLKNHKSNREIAKKLNINEGIVTNIRNHKSWLNYTKDIEFEKKRINYTFSKNDAERIINLLKEGKTTDEIQKIVKLPIKKIRHVKMGKLYPEVSKKLGYKNPNPIYRNKNISKETAEEIIEMLNNGYDNEYIYNKLKVSKLIISHIKQGKIFPELYKKILNKKRIVLTVRFRNGKEKRKSNFTRKVRTSDEIKQLLDIIIPLIMAGKTNKEIAKETGYKREFINDIRTRDLYANYTKDYIFPDIYKSRYTDQMFYDIADLLIRGFSNEDIARALPEYNLARHTVNAVRRHKMGRILLKDYKFPEPTRIKGSNKKLIVRYRINGVII